MSFLNSQGPVVNPRSPADDMSANAGCHANSGRFSEGGNGGASIHCLPFTAPGRNSKPSSAIKAINASRVLFSAAVLENVCSVSTIVFRGEAAFCVNVMPDPKNMKKIANRYFISNLAV